MKVHKSSQNSWQRWVFSVSYFEINEHGDQLFYKLDEFSIEFPSMYVNTNNSTKNKTKYIENVLKT